MTVFGKLALCSLEGFIAEEFQSPSITWRTAPNICTQCSAQRIRLLLVLGKCGQSHLITMSRCESFLDALVSVPVRLVDLLEALLEERNPMGGFEAGCEGFHA